MQVTAKQRADWVHIRLDFALDAARVLSAWLRHAARTPNDSAEANALRCAQTESKFVLNDINKRLSEVTAPSAVMTGQVMRVKRVSMKTQKGT